MPAPTPKELKKLIKVCREAGVIEYSGEGFSFKLSEQGTFQSKKVSPQYEAESANFETDTLAAEDLLMWSVGPGAIPFEDKQ